MTGSYMRETRESTVQQALETIRRRVDALGVTEPTLQIYGGSGQEVQDQIIVELPGIDDPDRVKSLIANTAQLELRLVKEGSGRTFYQRRIGRRRQTAEDISDDYEILPYREDRGEQSQLEYLIVSKVPVITGKDLKTARPKSRDSNGGAGSRFLSDLRWSEAVCAGHRTACGRTAGDCAG